MTISQNISAIDPDQKSYEDEITITDIPQGHFPAVTAMSVPDGSDTREITVNIFSLEQNPGGTQTVYTGLYIRKDGETAIKVTVINEAGSTAGSNTASY